MIGANVRLATSTIRRSKFRSILTMLGVIVGVFSVVTSVSIGEGVKRQVVGQINNLGSDLITIRPGKLVTRDTQGQITHINLTSGLGASSLSDKDLNSIKQLGSAGTVVPYSLITGVAGYDNKQLDSSTIIGTTPDIPQVLNKKVAYGDFFEPADENRLVAVIGKNVALKLFEEPSPLGKTIQIRGTEYIVRGVMDEFEQNPFALNGVDFNNAVFIPYKAGKQLTKDSVQIFQIQIKPAAKSTAQALFDDVTATLSDNHGGQVDFTVLKQDENLAVTNNIIALVTRLIVGLAALSLLVGGVGIMNIMLVSVSERTREIGVRKAIGATNRQIHRQFLTEATVLTIAGGIIGVAVSALAVLLLRTFTSLSPVITWRIAVLAVSVSVVVGIIFGLLPAARAAHKDPIDALRNE